MLRTFLSITPSTCLRASDGAEAKSGLEEGTALSPVVTDGICKDKAKEYLLPFCSDDKNNYDLQNNYQHNAFKSIILNLLSMIYSLQGQKYSDLVFLKLVKI